jgi:hypothetical protein
METFKTNAQYGNDLTLTIISRTEKTAVIKTIFGEQRVKVRNYNDLNEVIYFKCWTIFATELFDEKVALEISYFNAYYK